jgi:membrane fusion protein, multidrug efflux system
MIWNTNSQGNAGTRRIHPFVTGSVASLVFLFLLTGCSQKAEENTAKTVPVKVFAVRAESISGYVRATGSVTADEDVIVTSKTSERVEKINVRPGQAVKKGQVLVEQRNELLRKGLEISESAFKTAEAHSKLASADFERMDKLFAEKAISPQQYEQARTGKVAADQGLQQARSMVEQAREQLDFSLARAPFDGVAAAVYVEKNQMVGAGQPVVQVVSASRMKAKIYLSGSDVQQVKNGQDVMIKFPAIPGKEFAGRVDKINTAIDQTSKTVEVEIGLTSADKRVSSGLFGEFFIETVSNPNRLIIPETALIPQTEIRINRETGLQTSIRKYFLFLIGNRTARMKEVKTGISNDGQVEITEGLAAGDSVVIVGQNIVKDGQPVTVIE